MRRSAMLSTLTALALFVAAAGTLGCGGGSKPPGSLTVGWYIGAASCEEAGLESVDVELYYAQSEDLFDVQAKVACGAGQTTFETVDPGLYDVRVLGYPAGAGAELTPADATFEGTAAEVEVLSGEEVRVPGDIRLSGRKGAIYVSWRFADGDMCAVNGVTTVEITVYDAGRNEDAWLQVACDMSDYLATLPEEEVADGVRGVYIDELDAEPLSVEVIGYGRTGAATWAGRASFELAHGQVRDIPIRLEPR